MENDRQFIRSETLKTHISNSLSRDWSDYAILFCAIIISSVGLAENNLPIIVGSMLISPLMSPLLGISYGGVAKHKNILRKSIKLLIFQIFVGMVGSTIYFLASPHLNINQAILNRTQITLGVGVVALFGGVAAMIGSARRDPGNILPGVAIAASLMPPLATVGFGIATLNFDIFYGALLMFLTNVLLIILGASLGAIPIIYTQAKVKEAIKNKK